MNNIHTLISLFKNYNIDFYIIPSTDEFLNEYVPEYNNRLKFITNFTGSNGIAVVSKNNKNIFFTDGRYLSQSRQQIDSSFEIKDMQSESFNFYTAQLLKNNYKIGIDPNLHSAYQIENIQKLSKNNNLVSIKQNLIDTLWDKKPSKPRTTIFEYNLMYSGKSFKEKKQQIISHITSTLANKNAEFLILTDPHSICWLTNIRGDDLPCIPLALCYAILPIKQPSKNIRIFIDSSYTVKDSLYCENNEISFENIDTIHEEISKIKSHVLIAKNAPYAFIKALSNYSNIPDPCALFQACKNPVEIRNAVSIHKQDSAALSNFIAWIKNKTANDETNSKITELSLENKLLEFRKQQKDFVSNSFNPIIGFQENGAIIHYKSSKETNKVITGNGLLLIDSGGQYLGGTTDTTRTIAIGNPTEEQIHNFTLVLKGHIKVATAIFKEGETGSGLDKLARMFLQSEHKDFPHSTGHGVGNFLSVHEGPQSISKKSSIPLKPGMIVSIEPGFYKENSYGIRIENLAYIKKSPKHVGFLEFETLTRVPIDTKLIDESLLDDNELQWLKHQNS